MNSEQKSSTNNSFIKQAAILAAAGLFVRFMGFLYRVPLTNLIGDEGNSIYASGYQIYNFFLILSSAGLPAAISKLTSEMNAIGRQDEAHRVFKLAMLLSGTVSLICALAIALGSDLLTGLIQSPLSKNALLVLAPTVFIVGIMAVFRGYFQGMQTTVPTAISQIIEQVFNAVFSVLCAYLFMSAALKKSPEEALLAKAAGAAGGTAGTGLGALAGFLFLLVFYFLLHPLIQKNIKAAKSRSKEKESRLSSRRLVLDILRISLPIIAGTAVFSFTGLIDMFMVKSRLLQSGIVEAEVEKLYGLLQGKFMLLLTLPVSLSASIATASIPAISGSMKKGDDAAAKAKINTAIRVSMLLSIPAAVGLGVLGGPIIQMLFPSHPDGGYLLNLGFAAIIFLALTQILTGILQSLGHVNIPVFGALIGVCIKIPLNYFLVGQPHIGVSGAVFGTIACYLATAVFNGYMLRKTTGIPINFAATMIKPGLSAGVMGAACYVSYHVVSYLFPSNAVATIFSILTGLLFYVGFMLLLSGFSEEDIKMLPMGNKLAGFIKKRKLL